MRDPDTPALPRLPLLGIFAIWLLWGVWSGSQSLLVAKVGGPATGPRVNAMGLSLVSALFWALLTPCLMYVTRVIRDRLPQAGQRVVAHVVMFLLVHVADVTMYWFANDVISSNPRPFLPLLLSLVTFNGLTYTVVAVVITALDNGATLRARREREGQLETQLALAQFHALRAQLHPHFLFNALNAISSLMHTDAQRADRMLARVSELLRIAIDTAAKPEIRLLDEVEFAKRYLEIERMRYGDRLDVRVDVAGETFDALVPNMLLQPIVENAVRHGVAPHAGAGRVEIVATREGERLCIVVRDTGEGIMAGDIDHAGNGERTGSGVGLSTTRARLEKLYGSAQALSLVNIPGGFETRVSLPFRWRERFA